MSLKNSETLENLYSRKPYLRLYPKENSPDSGFFLKQARTPEEFFLERSGKAFASTVSPKKQAERLFSEKKMMSHHLVLVLGLGNPHLPSILHSSMRDGQILLLIDDSLESVPPLWEQFLWDILETPGRHLFAGENSIPLLLNYIESLPIDKITGILFFKNPTNIQDKPEFFFALEERISKLFSSKMSDLLTKFEFERIWVKNTISSILRYASPLCKRVPIRVLENAIQDIPAILVSAGPSLREQCEIIKKIRDKVFIFSCDTSLKVLLKFGIIPDGVMTLDAQTHSFYHFMGEDLTKIPLFADMVVSPQLIRSMKFCSIVHSQTAKYQIDAAGRPIRESSAGSDLVDEFIGNQGDVQSGGSVATSAFDALRFMGFKEIFLVGQDLAYTGREIHSTGTHHNEKWLTLIHRKNSLEKINEAIVRKRKTKYVPSSNGKEVLTDYVLEIYRHWFEESALSVDIKIYNVSQKGALINNIPSVNMEFFEDFFSKRIEHKYPWHRLSPWNGDVVVQGGGVDLAEKILEDLRDLEEKIQTSNFTGEFESEIESLLSEIKSKEYLYTMLRKTRIYILRHEGDLNDDKRKNLLLSAIRKEIRFLKKGIYTSVK